MAPILSRLSSGSGGSFGFGRKGGGATGPFSATGGNLANGLAPGNGYKYHTFGTPGSFVVSGSGTIELLVVGGGGAAYSPTNGVAGGGAGGLVYGSNINIQTGTYPVVVGSGGVAGITTSTAKGSNSSFGTIVANGGGFASFSPDNSGGSGAGGSAPTAPFGTGTQTPQTFDGQTLTGYGNPGGDHQQGPNPWGWNGGGGGGGAGGAGKARNTTYGDGGDGLQYPQFSGPLIGVPGLGPLNGYFAGGGGGGARDSIYRGGYGGVGGGGFGGPGSPNGSNGTPGVTYSGGGGGGGGQPGGGTYTSGSGGPGIVIIRYQV